MMANTPYGASDMMMLTSTIIALLMPSSTPTTAVRGSSPIMVSARPKKMLKTMIGSMLPSAIACTGFLGIMLSRMSPTLRSFTSSRAATGSSSVTFAPGSLRSWM